MQTPWRPTNHQIAPTADLSQLYESSDSATGLKIRAQRRTDDMVSIDGAEVSDSDWKPAAVKIEQEQPTSAFVVSATQTFSEADTMPAIDRRNDWKSIDSTDAGIVQSPMLHVQSQFDIDQVTGVVSDQRPHYEPWVQRERYVSSVSSSTTTTTVPPPKNNKAYRRPYQGRRNEDSLKMANSAQSIEGPKTAANLKNILKQTGGLSLSEILQQQNVSLDDLLKGKQNALKALQNTAAPPSPSSNYATLATGTVEDSNEDEDVGSNRKPMRRLPAMQQLNVHKPRRNFFNGTTRSFNRTEISSTPASSVETITARNEEPKEGLVVREVTPVQISSTHPTYHSTDESSSSDSSDGVRRLPSAASNSNSNRKRMPNMKFLKSKYRHQVSSTLETQPENEHELTNFAPSSSATDSNEEQRIEPNVISSSIADLDGSPLPMSSSTAPTTPILSTASIPKINMRERLAFRPPRLRNAPSSQQPISSSAEPSMIPSSTTIATTPSSALSTSTVPSEEPLPYTIITFATPSTEAPSHTVGLLSNVNIDSHEQSDNSQPMDELNRKLNESVPELNLVDLEDESKSKEVSSLEDLFISSGESMDPINNSGDQLPNETDDTNMDDEFIYASATSRSDQIYKSAADKPNSLKIFGGNLVNIIRKTIDKLDVTERNPGLFTDIVMAKNIDDKTELMDLLNDRRSGARLVKVLRQRNMTIDELIEHRKRGSSQVHLAEIFFNRNKAGEPSTTQPTQPESRETMQQQQQPHQSSKFNVVTAFKNFPDFKLDSVKSVSPDEIKTDSQGASYFTSIENIQPTAEIGKDARSIRKPFVINLAETAATTRQHNIPTHSWNTESNINSHTPRSEHNFLNSRSPAIASLFAASAATTKQHSNILRPSTGDETNMNTAFHDIVDQNRNDAAARSHDPLDLELSGHGYKRNNVLIENAQVPIGVRSAIVASASIVLISLTIFFVIFMVCRWRQRRKRKICYSDRFQALRGRLPILGSRNRFDHVDMMDHPSHQRRTTPSAASSKRSTSPAIAYLSSTANSSARRSANTNSKLNTMDPNSPEVQEYLYDAMRKPFQ